jgi:hypothetical protein
VISKDRLSWIFGNFLWNYSFQWNYTDKFRKMNHFDFMELFFSMAGRRYEGSNRSSKKVSRRDHGQFCGIIRHRLLISIQKF